MSNYQQQVLNSTPYYNHWLEKIKRNLNISTCKCLHTQIKNEKLLSTITSHNDTNIYHTLPLHVFFIVLRVENDDYIILTTNKDSDIGSGYKNFLQLPTGDIHKLEKLDLFQMIHLNIKKTDFHPILPNHFLLSDSNHIIKYSHNKWNWLKDKDKDKDTKIKDFDHNLIGWWTNPSITSQYCQFYQIIKNMSFSQFSNIIQEIEDRNDSNDSKLVIVHRKNLLFFSPDLRTTTALYLTDDYNKPPSYFLNRTDLYYSCIMSIIITLFIMLFIS